MHRCIGTSIGIEFLPKLLINNLICVMMIIMSLMIEVRLSDVSWKGEILFPTRCISQLAGLRGPEWRTLIERIASLPETHEDSLAFFADDDQIQ